MGGRGRGLRSPAVRAVPVPLTGGITNGGTSRDKPTTSCRRCGARRIDAQLGLEPTPEEYVANMVAVFREVRRVLRDDGTVWLNLGDCVRRVGDAAASTSPIDGDPHDGRTKAAPGEADADEPQRLPARPQAEGPRRHPVARRVRPAGGRLVPALRHHLGQAEPDAGERHRPADEGARVRVPADEVAPVLLRRGGGAGAGHDVGRHGDGGASDWTRSGHRGQRRNGRRPRRGTTGRTVERESAPAATSAPSGPSPRSRYPGAHFATFPQKLVEPCVKAGTSERGVCPECGAPWARETSASRRGRLGVTVGRSRAVTASVNSVGSGAQRNTHAPGVTHDLDARRRETTGWRPTCRHERSCGEHPATLGGCPPAEPVPATVMDPFGGTGTVGLVAQRLGRRAVLIDLNAEYLAQCLSRNRQVPLGLLGMTLDDDYIGWLATWVGMSRE